MKHIGGRALSLALLTWSAITLTTNEEHAWQSNIGLNFNFARYNFGNLPRLDGYLAGVHWDISHNWPSKWYVNLQFDGNWNAGPVASMCGNDCSCPPVLGCPDIRTSIKDFRPEFDFGYNVMFCENDQFSLTPFIGLGFLYLSNTLQPQNVMYGYRNLNVPIGLNALWVIEDDCFDIGLYFTYRIDAFTRLKLNICGIDMGTITCNNSCDCDCNTLCSTSTTTPTSSSCNNNCDDGGCNTIKLKHTQGVHFAVPMRWNYNAEDACMNMQAKVVPFFDWNKFGSADQCNPNNLQVAIPKLKQWYLGLHVDVGINF